MINTNMETITFGTEFLNELEAETRATRKCLEVIPEELFGWKPHERSMNLGYLSLLVAEIPKWIKDMVEKSEIDFASYEHFKLSTSQSLLNHFDENMEGAKRALKIVTNEELTKPFYLKNNGQVVFTSPKKESISSSINHMVHHRGQLTVYMRLNNLPVPSIYGPSADDRGF
jgi:uncharacterized damage-inducible protein DinB